MGVRNWEEKNGKNYNILVGCTNSCFAWFAPFNHDIFGILSRWATKTWPTFMSRDIIVAFNGFKHNSGDISGLVAIISRCGL